ncbi:MAG: ABC transporter permease [Gemmatimonadales bacterium]|nr:ABC transporter permease [Gemmatimonadales bacterium]
MPAPLPPLRFGMIRAPLVVFGVVTLTFLLLHLAPGDPVVRLLGPEASALDVARIRAALGLDRPVAEQFLRWISRAIRGDFGTSIATGRPVARMLWEAWPATVILVGLSIGLSHLLGIAVAAWQTTTRRRAVDGALSGLSVLLAALPGYWLAFVLVVVFSYALRWLPAFGAAGLDADLLEPGARLLDRLAHLALPLATLTLIGIGTTARYTQGTLRRVAAEPFLTLARAKGAGPARVLFRHHLRNGLIPVVTLLGLSLPALFSGAVFVEGVFAWPGIGSVLIQAVQARDYPVVMAATTVSALFVVLGSVAAEVLLHRVDPRARS